MIQNRIKELSTKEVNPPKCIVYIVSRDIRIGDNHALFLAQESSIKNSLPLVVIFNLYLSVRNRSKNQYRWMLEGLKEFELNLTHLNIPFYLTIGKSSKELSELIDKELSPKEVYFDFSPLKGPIQFKNIFAKNSQSSCRVVDTHNIVPVWESSNKEEFGAYTLRPKLKRNLNHYLNPVPDIKPQSEFHFKSISKDFISNINVDNLLELVEADEISNYYPAVKAGELESQKTLQEFLDNKLIDYFEDRNNPTVDNQSNLSAYLHFGNIASLTIVNKILNLCKQKNIEIEFGNKEEVKNFKTLDLKQRLKLSTEAYLEEIIVRKELADNYCYYNKNYNNIKGIKEWAYKSLKQHESDKREFIYSLKELETAQTHDNAWNASQNQLIKTGKIHGYMRMYWAKKILEWTPSIETALEYLVFLNDKYHLDGYDPNGYVGILWSIGGLHDRAWFKRPVFGQIRYMNYNGLLKKFDLNRYIDRWNI